MSEPPDPFTAPVDVPEVDVPPADAPSDPPSDLGDANEAARALRLAVVLVVLAIVPPLVLGWTVLQSGRRTLVEQEVERFRADAETRVRAVEGFLDTVRLDLAFLGRSRSVRELARVAAGRPLTVTAPWDGGERSRFEQARRATEEELLAFSVGRRAFHQVRYIDETGREVVRLNVRDGLVDAVSEAELQDKLDRYYVREGLLLGAGELYVSRLDVNVEHGQVEEPRRAMVRLVTRVQDDRGAPRGILVVNLAADALFAMLGALPRGTGAWLFDERGELLGVVDGAVDGDAPRLTPDDVASLVDGGVLEERGRVVSSRALRPAPDAERWLFVLGRPRSMVEAPVRATTGWLSALVAAVVVLTGSAGVLVARQLLRATRRLTDARASLRAVNESLETEVERRTDELRELERGMARADKLASIGQLTAGVLHEVGNPLAAIKTKIQVEQEAGLSPDEVRPLLAGVVREVDRLASFLRSFTRLSRLPRGNRQPLDLGELVDGVLALLAAELRRRGLTGVRVPVAGAPREASFARVSADADQLRQVVLNLLLNAANAEPRSGRVEVSIARADGHVRLTVSDDGVGVPAEHVARLFDPFFTTRPDGSGLGLSICERIVREHGGTIDVDTEAGVGTRVTVSLPEARA